MKRCWKHDDISGWRKLKGSYPFLKVCTINKGFFSLMIFLVTLTTPIIAQHGAATLEFYHLGSAELQSRIIVLDLDADHLFSWGVRIDNIEKDATFALSYRLQYDDGPWSPVRILQGDIDLMDEPGKWISGLQFLDEELTKEHKKLRLQFEMPATTFAEANIHLIHVPFSGRKISSDPVKSRSDCEKPVMITRDEWCSGSCPPRQEPAVTHQQFMIVHHSASSNTSSNWASVVESFYLYHVNGNGWDDIGYNWLIDPDGVVYVGRGDETQGAHFCAQNPGTAGICVIGTYTYVEPTDKAMQSLKELLAWKLEKENIDPMGVAYHAASNRNLPRITGHRIACDTECPGDQLFRLLQTFPAVVDTYMKECGTIMPRLLLKGYVSFFGTVYLNWESDIDIQDDWDIYRKREGEDFLRITSVDNKMQVWVDSDVKYGARYYYYVTPKGDLTVKSNEYIAFTGVDGLVVGNSIYPNPAQNSFTVRIVGDTRETYKLEMYNDRGEKIVNNSLSQKVVKKNPVLEYQVNLSGISPGVYFFRMTGEQTQIMEKILVH